MSTVVVDGSCWTGFNVSHADLTLSAVGGDCSFGIGVGEVDGESGSWGGMTPGGIGCGPVTELCYSVVLSYHSNPWLDGAVEEDCVAWALGAPPTAVVQGQDCSYGVPYPVGLVEFDNTQNGSSVTRNDGYQWQIDDVTGTRGWYPYVVLGGVTNTDVLIAKQSPSGNVRATGTGFTYDGVFMTHRNEAPIVTSTASSGVVQESTVGWWSSASWNSVSGTVQPREVEVVGFGLAYRMDGVNTGSSTGAMTWRVENLPDSATSTALVGVTDPTRCAYYWGDKIVDVPDVDWDEPAGVLPEDADGSDEVPSYDDPVATSDGTCEGFSLTDPTSWAGAGICVLVKLMGSLISAVLGLPAAIIELVIDALKLLFIPTDFQSFNKLNNAVDDTNLASWRDGIESAGFGSSSGGVVGRTTDSGSSSDCMGPGFDLSGMEFGDESVEFGVIYPFAACDGKLADAASLVRTILLVMICLSVGFRVIGMIGTSIGLIKNTNQMIRFDWSSPDSGRIT
ncbi:hypothetical protein [Nocardioides sp.]|uniref:hypothetical protein n=1 Tax=Nocardioides sp. TaxID=35761 RepID=UPI0039E36530